MAPQEKFHVVVYEEGGWWIAQCLECNLAASARDSRDLKRKLDVVIRVQIEADSDAGVEPFSRLQKAPPRFWKMYQGAHRVPAMSNSGLDARRADLV